MIGSLKKKFLPVAIATAMASGALFSSTASAISISTENKGQVLMSPIYLAQFGYSTKVSIINTRTDIAVKVRIALRSHKFSDEFDFICMMTPADVCTFEITRGDDGQAYLTSTDDSILASEERASFASECAGSDPGEFCDTTTGQLKLKVLDYALRTDKDGNSLDDNEMGHLEVVGAWAVQSGEIVHPEGQRLLIDSLGNIIGSSPTYDASSVIIKREMSKAELYKIMGPDMQRSRLAAYNPENNESLTYSTGRTVITAAGTICSSAPPSEGFISGTPCSVENRGVSPQSKVRSTDPSWIQLIGQVEMNNGNDRMGIQMVALKGQIWDNLMPSSNTPRYGLFSRAHSGDVDSITNQVVTEQFDYAFDGRVISNPLYDIDFSAEVIMGDKFGGSRVGLGSVQTYDNIIEIESLLAASSITGRFNNENSDKTNLIITFPTKYRHDSSVIYREGRRGANDVFPEGPKDLGDANDKSDVCAGELNSTGNHLAGDIGLAPRPGHLLGDARLYELRDFYPPFKSDGSVLYSLSVYDDQEHITSDALAIPIFSPGISLAGRAITDEVNYMFMQWPDKKGFGTGWFKMSFSSTLGCGYKGMPVIAYAHKTQVQSDGSFSNSWLVPLTKD